MKFLDLVTATAIYLHRKIKFGIIIFILYFVSYHIYPNSYTGGFILIRIVTDSSCDFDLDQAAQMKVDVVPLHIYFGETEYLDRQTLSVADFYEKLETVDKLPSTAQVNPHQFIEVFQPYVEAGDEIVGIFLSSELSGTYQSALMARNQLNGSHIHIVDSRNAALGHHLLIQIAVQLRDQGLSAAEIAEQITALSKRVRLTACVKTMKYLVMGGRVSPALGKIGGVLGITPLIEVTGGKVESAGKVRGHKAANRWIHQYIEQHPLDNQYPAVFTQSVNPEGRDELIAALSDVLSGCSIMNCDLGCTIGTHIGPGAIGIAYIEKE